MRPQHVIDLRKMGYRPMDSEQMWWGKPVGYTLYAIKFGDVIEWGQHFVGANGKLCVWSLETVDDSKSLLGQLQEFETYKVGKYRESLKTFEFLSPEEWAEALLDGEVNEVQHS